MLHALTIGLSAFLLFNLQPMVTKLILPLFGGGSSIWLTSMIFFQALLLAGYAYVHCIVLKLSVKQQIFCFFSIIALALLLIPLQMRCTLVAMQPTAKILLVLLTSVGIPYFLLSCTSPLVQFIIGISESSRFQNPYVLYAVSNIGSMAGLFSYPLLIEPNMQNKQQIYFWSAGFLMFALLLGLCLFSYLKALKQKQEGVFEKRSQDNRFDPNESNGTVKAKWFVNAFIPSWALMVFTHYMTMDIVNLPLLWVMPLSFYLLSFIVSFLWSGLSKPSLIRTITVLLPVAATIIVVWSEIRIGFVFKLVLSLVCLFAICMFFHGNLERLKPAPAKLTSFYLYLSLGGLGGGLFVGIFAPVLFKSTVEYDLLLCIVFYFIVAPYLTQVRKKIKIFFQIIFVLLLIAVFILQETIFMPPCTYKARSFYGAFKVKEWPAIPNRQVAHRLLKMGTTTHGGQAVDALGHLFPIAYYHEKTGVGKAFLRLQNIQTVGFVGLGAGVLALYGQNGQTFDFYEIDQTVVDIARKKFDNLRVSPANIRYFVGDARILLRKAPIQSYNMLILDAFSSGAIPTHLLTLEAMEEFGRIIKKDGLLLYHISNRYIDLLPVLQCNAQKLGLLIKIHENPPDKMVLKYSSRWVAIGRNRQTFDQLTKNDSNWKTPHCKNVCWTDNFSNIWSVVNF